MTSGLAQRLAGRLRAWAHALDEVPFAKGQEGKLVRFIQTGTSLGYPVYSVNSVRGGLYLGTIDYSNQWRAAKFTPAPGAVFDKRCVAEIYAMLNQFAR